MESERPRGVFRAPQANPAQAMACETLELFPKPFQGNSV